MLFTIFPQLPFLPHLDGGGKRKVVGVGADDTVQTHEVFKFDQKGMTDEGVIQGEHAYVRESMLIEKFYRAGALKRPGRG